MIFVLLTRRSRSLKTRWRAIRNRVRLFAPRSITNANALFFWTALAVNLHWRKLSLSNGPAVSCVVLSSGTSPSLFTGVGMKRFLKWTLGVMLGLLVLAFAGLSYLAGSPKDALYMCVPRHI